MLLQISTPELYNWTRINKEVVRHFEFPFQINTFVLTNLSSTVTLLDNNRHDTYSLYNVKRFVYKYLIMTAYL